MATAARLMLKVDGDTRGGEQALQRMHRGVDSFVRGVGQVAAGFGVGRLIERAADEFLNLAATGPRFEAGMANVNSIAQLTTAELQKLSDQVIALGADPRIAQAPDVLAQGLYDIQSSGFDAAHGGLDVLKQSALAATAGLTTTDVAARAIAGGLNAFGLGADQARRVSDVLFETVNAGVLTFEQLASNLGNTMPIANSLGISIEELGAAYAQMTLKGVSAAQAETQIASLMRAALNPTDALSAAVQKHGFASAAAAIEQEGLAGFLRIVTKEAGNDKEALFSLLGTQEAMNAATILGAEVVADYVAMIDRMKNASDGAGATNKALEKQMQSASFQVKRMKVELARLVTIGFSAIAPAVARLASGLTLIISRGLIPFTSVMGKALSGSFAFKELLDDVPRPLREFARGLGVVFEGVGDLAEFMLQGDWSRVANRLPGELRQVVGGLRVLGDELAAGARFAANIAIDLVTSFAGAIWDNRGRIAAWIGEQLGNLGGALIDIGKATVSGLLSLGGDLLDAAGDLWGWVKGKLTGTGLERGDITSGLVLPSEREIDFGRLLVTGLLALGRGLRKAASVVAALVKDKLRDLRVGPIDWTLELDPIPDIEFSGLGFDFGRAMRKKVDEFSVDDVRWVLVVGAPASVIAANPFLLPLVIPHLVGELLFGVGPIGLVSWVLTVGLPGAIVFGLSFAFGFFPSLVDKVNGINAVVALTEWTLTAGAPVLLGITLGNLIIWVEDAIKGAKALGTVSTDLGPWDLAVRSPVIGGLTLGELIIWIEDQINAVKQAGLFVVDLGAWTLDVITPAITGITRDDIKDAIRDFILSPGALEITIPINIVPDIQFGASTDGGNGEATALVSGGGPGGGFAALAGFFGRAKMGGGFALPAPDTSAVDGALARVRAALASLVAQTWRPTLGLDAAPFTGALVNSLRAGNALDALTFTPTISADPTPFASVMLQSLRAGQAFAATTFEATLAADTGPVQNALVGAYTAGHGWAAQTFTARFAVDTSPLLAAVDVARRVAQEISDLLPRSPAKKGPLARPISFGYIADDLRATMRDMAGITERGLGAAFGPAGGRFRGAAGLMGLSGRPIVIVNAVKSDEMVRLIRDAEDGGQLARGLAREIELTQGIA